MPFDFMEVTKLILIIPRSFYIWFLIILIGGCFGEFFIYQLLHYDFKWFPKSGVFLFGVIFVPLGWSPLIIEIIDCLIFVWLLSCLIIFLVLDLDLWCGCILARGTDDNFGTDDTIIGNIFIPLPCVRFFIVVCGWVVIFLFRI